MAGLFYQCTKAVINSSSCSAHSHILPFSSVIFCLYYLMGTYWAKAYMITGSVGENCSRIHNTCLKMYFVTYNIFVQSKYCVLNT